LKAWKRLERLTADLLGGVRVERVSTPLLSESWLVSAPDVIVAGPFPLVVECKVRKRFAHHAMLQEACGKYCHNGEEPVLVTREPGRHACATVRLEFMAKLLRGYHGS
jgi:hypothetical protein